MSTPRKDPADQFQFGDHVVYLPEGIVTQVAGYAWTQEVGSAPRVVGYQLACGITVGADVIERYEPPRREIAGRPEPVKRFRL